MSKLIDLSHKIYNKMPVYPGDIDVELENDKTLKKDEYCNHNLKMGMHTGTHLDLPAHLLASDYTAADLDLNTLSGKAKIIDAAGENIIGYKSEYKEKIAKDDIVIIYTGFEEKYGKKEYYQQHPIISERLVDFLLTKEIKILGFDMPSPDYSPFEIHKKLLGEDIYILENLSNLKSLLQLDSFRLFIFPLKVEAEAAPCRVAAEI